MSDYERAMLVSKNDMEDALRRIETRIASYRENRQTLPWGTTIMRSLCRAVYILLDWAIRKERSNGKQ